MEDDLKKMKKMEDELIFKNKKQNEDLKKMKDDLTKMKNGRQPKKKKEDGRGQPFQPHTKLFLVKRVL